MVRIDPRTNKVIATISTNGYPGNRQPRIDDCACVYAAGDGSVWVIGNSTTLVRIDPQTNRVVASLTLEDRLGSIVLGDGGIWISSDGANPTPTIYRIDPQAMGAPPLATSGGMPVVALLGTYRRTFSTADRIAAHDPGLTDWVGHRFTIVISKQAIYFLGMDASIQNSADDTAHEYYRATADGRLTMGGYLPDNPNSFCSDDPHLLVPSDLAASEGLTSNAPAPGTTGPAMATPARPTTCTDMPPWQTRLARVRHLPCLRV